jgi:hypothetical protein
VVFHSYCIPLQTLSAFRRNRSACLSFNCSLFTCPLAIPPGRCRHLAQPAQPKCLVELDRLRNLVSQEMKAFRQASFPSTSTRANETAARPLVFQLFPPITLFLGLRHSYFSQFALRHSILAARLARNLSAGTPTSPSVASIYTQCLPSTRSKNSIQRLLTRLGTIDSDYAKCSCGNYNSGGMTRCNGPECETSGSVGMCWP